jgi:hypothetical protein
MSHTTLLRAIHLLLFFCFLIELFSRTAHLVLAATRQSCGVSVELFSRKCISRLLELYLTRCGRLQRNCRLSVICLLGTRQLHRSALLCILPRDVFLIVVRILWDSRDSSLWADD